MSVNQPLGLAMFELRVWTRGSRVTELTRLVFATAGSTVRPAALHNERLFVEALFRVSVFDSACVRLVSIAMHARCAPWHPTLLNCRLHCAGSQHPGRGGPCCTVHAGCGTSALQGPQNVHVVPSEVEEAIWPDCRSWFKILERIVNKGLCC